MTGIEETRMRLWHLFTAVVCYSAILTTFLDGQTLNSSPMNRMMEEQRNQDTLVINLLSALKGQPEPLSSIEVNKLRQTTPSVVERFVKLINQDKLVDDVTTGILDKRTFDDLSRSLVFLETGNHGSDNLRVVFLFNDFCDLD